MFKLTPTIGLVSGLTVQFAEGRRTGRWADEIGDGVALELEAFDLIAPLVKEACPKWTRDHTYGVFEIPADELPDLIRLLRSESTTKGAEAGLRHELADWLAARSGDAPISILGV